MVETGQVFISKLASRPHLNSSE